jgi:hypothetical protein
MGIWTCCKCNHRQRVTYCCYNCGHYVCRHCYVYVRAVENDDVEVRLSGRTKHTEHAERTHEEGPGPAARSKAVVSTAEGQIRGANTEDEGRSGRRGFGWRARPWWIGRVGRMYGDMRRGTRREIQLSDKVEGVLLGWIELGSRSWDWTSIPIIIISMYADFPLSAFSPPRSLYKYIESQACILSYIHSGHSRMLFFFFFWNMILYFFSIMFVQRQTNYKKETTLTLKKKKKKTSMGHSTLVKSPLRPGISI